MIAERVVISVGSAPDISLLANWGHYVFLSRLGLQGFSRTVKRSVIGLESVPGMGQVVHISLIVLWPL